MAVQTKADVLGTLPTNLDEVPLPDPLPPLVITAFTRPDLLAPVLAAIDRQSLPPRQIIAYMDGARNEKDVPRIEECVRLLEDFARPDRSVQVIRHPQNLGCDQNVITSFTEVLKTHNSLVYIEDDDAPNEWCYDRLCRLLEAYKDHPQVFSVAAYASLSMPENLIEPDFFPSHRVFSWGFGIWSDRWQEMDLAHKSGQYNPFGSYYKIPAKAESKMTLVNQFWLEKNHKTDWVITMTLFALSRGKVHLMPKHSLVKNIGFGHAESETYRGQEDHWVNCRYEPDFKPVRLPHHLEPHTCLETPLTGGELAQFFDRKQLWLTPAAWLYFLRKYPTPKSVYLWTALFFRRLPTFLKRLKSGRTV